MASHPKARAGLMRHELDGQSVVYDPATERVHLLDATTGRVLELLDGTRGRDALAAELTRQLGRPCDHEVVALALDELAKAELLDADAVPAARLPDAARRDLLKKLGVAAAALVIPTVLSVTPAHAQTTSCRADGAACTSVTQCCGNICDGVCATIR